MIAARLRRIAFRASPVLLGLLLNWCGLHSWFQKDDFAWLGLKDMVHNTHDLWAALVTPMAQGTIRPLSERLVFLSFTSLFGLVPLPFHVLGFLTYAAATIMLGAVCAKLTDSRAAGFTAGIIWSVSSPLAVALAWPSIYYEILCSLIFVVSLWLLIRYVETRQFIYYLAQCGVFLLGFGVLELNVVYPALAGALLLFRAPRRLSLTIPLFALSAIYTIWHTLAVTLPRAGIYRLHWDVSIIATLWTYWKWALGPTRLNQIGVFPSFARSAAAVLLMAGLLGFLVWKLCRRQWIAAFFPAWFLIVLSPLLPLRDHVSDYYLIVPLIGFAMWGGWAAATGWQGGWPGKAAATILLVVYVAVSAPVSLATASSFYARSRRIEATLDGIVRLSRNDPRKTIVLQGVDSEMFWSAFFHRPLRLYGIHDVYLSPDNDEVPAAEWQAAEVKRFFIDPGYEATALAENQALLIDITQGNVRDVTAAYRSGHTGPFH